MPAEPLSSLILEQPVGQSDPHNYFLIFLSLLSAFRWPAVAPCHQKKALNMMMNG